MLAPAGTLEVFQAAVEAGADAVYVGAPQANARALARHFTLEEIAAMLDFAHRRGVKLYLAMNSLVKDEELPAVVELLSVAAGLGVDAVIVQDLGVYHLARRHFPELRLHASTLMGAHNSVNVRQLAGLGFSRVVLARELSVTEIALAAASAPVEIEVFIHGAMCFAYSGLCLFSSFLGGKSGLRGRCVQPCRRKYTWRDGGAKGGYLFSMNDLQGLGLIGELRAAGVGSFKIEGRMRSRQYVETVVRAYRLALDAPDDPAALREAEETLSLALGRKTSSGYFRPGFDESLISPQYSGNIGLFVGKIDRCRREGADLVLREPLRLGDRIRIHNERSGERGSLTVREMWLAGRSVERAEPGQTVRISAPEGTAAGDPVYKVDTLDSRKAPARAGALLPKRFAGQVARERRRDRIGRIAASLPQAARPRGAEGLGVQAAKARGGVRRPPRRSAAPATLDLALPWWLRIDDPGLLGHLPRNLAPERVVVLLSPESQRRMARLPLAPELRRRLIWGLPPVILEADLDWYRQAIAGLGRQGFGDWQVAHVGQALLVREAMASSRGLAAEAGTLARRGGKAAPGGGRRAGSRPGRVTLFGHYSLNVMNVQALKALAEVGIESAQVSIEADRELVAALAGRQPGRLGMTVFGFPPLFTARSHPGFFQYGHTFVSPRGEEFTLVQSFGQTLALPAQPFSLLDRLPELKAAGLDYLVVDLTAQVFKRGELPLFWRRLEGGKAPERASAFNYRVGLQ